jgi:hypothetical protein
MNRVRFVVLAGILAMAGAVAVAHSGDAAPQRHAAAQPPSSPTASTIVLPTATVTATGITVPGRISALPDASPAKVTLAPLPLDQAQASARHALDAAEAAWGVTDSDVDPNARAMPAVISVGNGGLTQNVKAWVVTLNHDTYSQGPAWDPVQVKHKLVVVIDATTGKYLMAYNAGPSQIVQPAQMARPTP